MAEGAQPEMKKVMAYNPAFWMDGVKGHEDQLGWCQNDLVHHFQRPECMGWRGLWTEDVDG